MDYDTWDPQLGEDEDVERHIRTGSLVPINIRSDGAFGSWSVSAGAVGAQVWPGTVQFDLPVGRYAVVIHLIAWEDEEGGVNEDGTPSAAALPDFVVLVSPTGPEQDLFRSDVETFDRTGEPR
ncbi:hypothetical protein AQJ46_28560 [Streptomyces canus]|uniref:Uncharacterized protein n=1 Tax=Streptomyces canus TaxID=58343 RepID=A0A101S0I0_9ACTN|nr:MULTISPECIES: hypothetical protein [Streptomyces]KUN65061.1 hypothetical protein AQJ46_28560 [Streptomyces canus]MDI5909578.1 hypothetical protein [Streptomyces sp. 12257]